MSIYYFLLHQKETIPFQIIKPTNKCNLFSSNATHVIYKMILNLNKELFWQFRRIGIPHPQAVKEKKFWYSFALAERLLENCVFLTPLKLRISTLNSCAVSHELLVRTCFSESCPVSKHFKANCILVLWSPCELQYGCMQKLHVACMMNLTLNKPPSMCLCRKRLWAKDTLLMVDPASLVCQM